MSTEFRVVAIIAAYNEEDIIGQVVGHLVSQGVDVYFLDHGSTDGTLAEVQPYVGRGVMPIEQLSEGGSEPCAGTGTVAWESILRRKEALAEELDANWFIHHDADEFRESPWAHLNLSEAIRTVDRFGYNAIDFEVLNFRPTHDRFRRGDDVREAFPFYEPAAPYDRVQIKCWKKGDHPVDLARSGGHDARFPGRNVFPMRFLLRHYPIRGQAHGERKVFRERRGRFVQAERERGWHVQYDGIAEGHSFVWDASRLTRYDPETARLQLVLCHRGVEELANTSSAQQQALEGAGREVARLSQDLHVRTRQLETVGADLGARTRELEQAHVDLRARTRELEQAHVDLRARARELEEVRGALALQEGDLARLRARLEGSTRSAEQLAAALNSATERVAALEGSRSWRWTAPLRAIQRWLGGR